MISVLLNIDIIYLLSIWLKLNRTVFNFEQYLSVSVIYGAKVLQYIIH